MALVTAALLSPPCATYRSYPDRRIKTGLAYVPAPVIAGVYSDKGITRANWKRTPGNAVDAAVNIDISRGWTGPSTGLAI